AGTRVRFLKQYPVFYAYLEGKLVPLGDQMEKEHGIRLDHDVLPRPIRYQGEYDALSGVVRGSWRITSGRSFVRRGGRLLLLFLPGGTGDWEMKRQVG